MPGARFEAFQAARGSQVRRTGLLRSLVHAIARSPGRVCCRNAERRNRHGDAEAVQGQHSAGRTPVRVFALSHGPVFLHHERNLQPERCGRLHPDSWSAGTFPRTAETEDRSAGDRKVKMWSGRFRQPLDPKFEQWQRSFPFDQKLLPYELAASRAHALTLRAADVISDEELNQILAGLHEIGQRVTEKAPGFLDDAEAEDVHHFVEKKLVELIGETGKKLHSGRSRNEQIATDL